MTSGGRFGESLQPHAKVCDPIRVDARQNLCLDVLDSTRRDYERVARATSLENDEANSQLDVLADTVGTICMIMINLFPVSIDFRDIMDLSGEPRSPIRNDLAAYSSAPDWMVNKELRSIATGKKRTISWDHEEAWAFVLNTAAKKDETLFPGNRAVGGYVPNDLAKTDPEYKTTYYRRDPALWQENARDSAKMCEILDEWSKKETVSEREPQKHEPRFNEGGVRRTRFEAVSGGRDFQAQAVENSGRDRFGTGLSEVLKPDGWTRAELVAQANHNDENGVKTLSPSTFDNIRKAAGITPSARGGAGAQRRYSVIQLRQLIAAAETGNFLRGKKIATWWGELLLKP